MHKNTDDGRSIWCKYDNASLWVIQIMPDSYTAVNYSGQDIDINSNRFSWSQIPFDTAKLATPASLKKCKLW